ncbi:alkaline-phosphatase-like protein [Schizothecium vesticola]|uniref:GPI ethanolamine phosphate transferase 2 n=1 Tax=Schizothecium vesticola TaxID=314040 RepID=A0AA40F8F5_9PEZI|nr:alkaline-phosphatase-like protein [Schizothecium vesticola]
MSSSSSRRNGTLSATLLLVAANILVPAAIYLFATGFFPYKPLLQGLSEYSPLVGDGAPPQPPFDRLVFMVVDALRSDFVYSPNSGFEYVQSLIRDGVALPFTAHAASPTVTMPRLKAITTGSIPSFLDVVLNLNEGDESSTLAFQDTWLAQMKAKDTGKLLMYGDDTWLKLFPGTFDRLDGTTSFFVSDFTEVDNNVTRHIAEELKNDDWNTMVLHYLGLDHIGHKGGPRSPHMVPKQREMDGIVKQIFTAIETQPHLQSTLFVVCGDHGMNDAGNHGASSPGETSPALVFMSPKIKAIQKGLPTPVQSAEDFQYYTTVEQSDLAPTLAALLGFPVPKNNLGALIPEFLPFWSSGKDQSRLLMQNAHQILDVITAAFGTQILGPDSQVDCTRPESDYQELACQWRDVSSAYAKKTSVNDLDPQWVSAMVKWLRKAQGLMSGMASNYNIPRLLLGLAVIVGAVAVAAAAVSSTVGSSVAQPPYLTIIILAYGAMMFASSYVEEEHHFWYWATTAWFGLLGFQSVKNSPGSRASHAAGAILMLVIVRLMRAWNQTGQKFAGEPDIVKIFLHPNPLILWSMVSIVYIWIHRMLIHGFNGIPAPISYAAMTGSVLAAISFKVHFTQEDAPELIVGFARTVAELEFTQGQSLVSQARAVFIALGIATAVALFYILMKWRLSVTAPAIDTLHHLLTLLAITQSRTTNIPLFLLFHLQYRLLDITYPDLPLVDLSTSSLLLQYTSFFALGGSNAISSVDLSSAYNGVAGYDAAVVGLLTFVGNWAGPIYWTSATTLLLLRRARRDGSGFRVFLGHVAVQTLFAACSVAAVMAACTVLRTHLFVWTVFSPKYLYCVAWSVGQHLVVNVGLGGVLFWLGSL